MKVKLSNSVALRQSLDLDLWYFGELLIMMIMILPLSSHQLSCEPRFY